MSAMKAGQVVLNYKDYAALPSDGRRYEIHEGELSVTPAPGTRHQEVSGNLLVALHTHVKARGLGKVFAAPIDVILSDISIVQPDLIYVASDSLGVVSSRGIEGAPTLVVEILSPSTIQIDRHTKLQLYARYGVLYYWIVDPEARLIEAYRLEAGSYALSVRSAGHEPFSAEPLGDLILTAAAVWA
jgi:Uma2 family endonuclease